MSFSPTVVGQECNQESRRQDPIAIAAGPIRLCWLALNQRPSKTTKQAPWLWV